MNRIMPATLWASMVFEYRMAARRGMLWLAVLPLLALSALTIITSPRTGGLGSAAQKLGTWSMIVSILVTIGIGVAMADRFARVHRLSLAELLVATPASAGLRMLGVLLGSLAAALTPVAVFMLVAGLIVAITDSSPAAPFWAFVATVVVILPGALLLTTLAAALGLVLPLPVVRVLIVVFWFWACLFNTTLIPLPSPTGTLLSPLGDYAAVGWLGAKGIWAGDGHPAVLSPTPNGGAAVLSVVSLLLVTTVVFAIARVISARRS